MEAKRAQIPETLHAYTTPCGSVRPDAKCGRHRRRLRTAVCARKGVASRVHSPDASENKYIKKCTSESGN